MEQDRTSESSDLTAYYINQVARGFSGPASAGGTPPEGPPPSGPSTAEAGDMPDRGRALQGLFDLTGALDQQIGDELFDRITADQGSEEYLDTLMQEGYTLDQAVAILGYGAGDADSPDRQLVTAHLDAARQTHNSVIRATGLDFSINFIGGIALKIINAEAFTAALQQLELASTEEGRSRQTNHIDKILGGAVTGTYEFTVRQNLDRARRMAGTRSPTGSELYIAGESEMSHIPVASPNDAELAVTLPLHAREIAQALQDRDHPGPFVEQMQCLATAQEQGQLVEWAVACDLDILDYSEGLIGVDRLVTPEEWDSVQAFLDHLAQTAPGSPLTAQIRDILIRDLDAALSGEDPIVIQPGEGWLEGMGAEWQLLRQERIEAVNPLLREVRQHIYRIFGR